MQEFTPEQWVHELESNGWNCTTGQLVNKAGSAHCCLGVAARLAGYADQDLRQSVAKLWVGWDVTRRSAHDDWVWKQHERGAPPPPPWLTAAVAYELSACNDRLGMYPVDLIRELLIEEE